MNTRLDLTPSWHAAMQILIIALEDGTQEGKKHARAELMDLADKVDTINGELRAKTMKRIPSYLIEVETDDHIILRDIGPWEDHPTITNGAELVVQEMLPQLRGRKLYYYDSEGELDELVVADGKFTGFAAGGPENA